MKTINNRLGLLLLFDQCQIDSINEVLVFGIWVSLYQDVQAVLQELCDVKPFRKTDAYVHLRRMVFESVVQQSICLHTEKWLT